MCNRSCIPDISKTMRNNLIILAIREAGDLCTDLGTLQYIITYRTEQSKGERLRLNPGR